VTQVIHSCKDPAHALLKSGTSPITTLRIMLVEYHLSFREALAFLLTHKPDIELVAQDGSLAEAREALLDGRLDVAVVDLGLPDRLR
jgi:CheY-like chemotaxis protein